MKQAMYKIRSFMPNSQNKTDYNDMHNISKKRNNKKKRREKMAIMYLNLPCFLTHTQSNFSMLTPMSTISNTG